jgi:hypothetical protein
MPASALRSTLTGRQPLGTGQQVTPKRRFMSHVPTGNLVSSSPVLNHVHDDEPKQLALFLPRNEHELAAITAPVLEGMAAVIQHSGGSRPVEGCRPGLEV